MSGEIPPWLGGLSNLVLLSLHRNQLSGEIPLELAGLSNLESLDLSGNQLSGEIPPELGDLSNLEALWLHDNQLSGCIPSFLRDVEEGALSRTGLPFCALSTVVDAGILAAERAALVALYEATRTGQTGVRTATG